MTAAALEKLAAKMDQLPQAPKTMVTSRMAAIQMLQPQIEGMRAKGYDYTQIAAWLADNAPLDVSPSTIRTALSKARVEETGDPKSPSTKDKTKPAGANPETASAPPPELKQTPKATENKPVENKQAEKNSGEKPFQSAFGDDRI
jgi:hypothetical protein